MNKSKSIFSSRQLLIIQETIYVFFALRGPIPNGGVAVAPMASIKVRLLGISPHPTGHPWFRLRSRTPCRQEVCVRCFLPWRQMRQGWTRTKAIVQLFLSILNKSREIQIPKKYYHNYSGALMMLFTDLDDHSWQHWRRAYVCNGWLLFWPHSVDYSSKVYAAGEDGIDSYTVTRSQDQRTSDIALTSMG